MTLLRHYTISCDGCGEEFDAIGPVPSEIKAWARKEGWALRTRLPEPESHNVKGDLCPACLTERNAAVAGRGVGDGQDATAKAQDEFSRQARALAAACTPDTDDPPDFRAEDALDG